MCTLIAAVHAYPSAPLVIAANRDERGALVIDALRAPSVDDLHARLAGLDPRDFEYGTRSSMILVLGPAWTSTRLLWAEGRPCVTPYVDQGALLAELVSAG